MNRNILTIALAGFLFFGVTSCNSDAKAIDSSKTNVTENTENETDPMIMEAGSENKVQSEGNGVVRRINTQTFIAEIFDYKSNPKIWIYKGNKPAIIDFYADWCGPCKKVAPIMDELALKYRGKVNFYKINTDEEKELSGSVFGIRSIPSILYIPVDGQPMMSTGLYPREEYINQIETALLNK